MSTRRGGKYCNDMPGMREAKLQYELLGKKGKKDDDFLLGKEGTIVAERPFKVCSL